MVQYAVSSHISTEVLRSFYFIFWKSRPHSALYFIQQAIALSASLHICTCQGEQHLVFHKQSHWLCLVISQKDEVSYQLLPELWVVSPLQDLWMMKALTKSVRWKNSFFVHFQVLLIP
jgi:hypothetical protein